MTEPQTTLIISAHVDHDALKAVLEKHKMVFHEIPWRDTYRDDDDGDTYSIITWGNKSSIKAVEFVEIAIEALALSKYRKGFFIESALGEKARCSFGFNKDFDHCSSTLSINEDAVKSSATKTLKEICSIIDREKEYPQ